MWYLRLFLCFQAFWSYKRLTVWIEGNYEMLIIKCLFNIFKFTSQNSNKTGNQRIILWTKIQTVKSIRLHRTPVIATLVERVPEGRVSETQTLLVLSALVHPCWLPAVTPDSTNFLRSKCDSVGGTPGVCHICQYTSTYLWSPTMLMCKKVSWRWYLTIVTIGFQTFLSVQLLWISNHFSY